MSDCNCNNDKPDRPANDPCLDNDPTNPPPCKKYLVSFMSIDVQEASDGFLDHSLEAEFTFSVNHDAKVWESNLGTGRTNIDMNFYVDILSDQSNIVIQVSGIERDPVVSDDILAGFSRTYGRDQNWGLGFQSASASDGNISYTMNFKIDCAPESTAVVPRNAMSSLGSQDTDRKLQAQQEYLRQLQSLLGGQSGALRSPSGSESRGAADTAMDGQAQSDEDRIAALKSESNSISNSIDRFKRAGWECVHITENEFVFKGYGDFPAKVNRWYQEQSSKKKVKKKK